MPNVHRPKPKSPPKNEGERPYNKGWDNVKGKSWQPGQSGNPSGKSRNLNEIMRQARSHAPEAIDRLLSIIRDETASNRDVIQACIALLDRGCGKAVVPVFQGAHGLPMEMIGESGADGSEITALLACVKESSAGGYRRALKAEMDRLDAEERIEKTARQDQVDRARKDHMNGRPIDPAMRLLLSVKDSD
jgi:hypothetical protein